MDWAGIGEGLNSLAQNKMFLQFLAAAGQDIGSGQPIGTNVNKATMQNISAQNYMKILQQLLGPDDTKGTFDKSGMKLDIPASALGSLSNIEDIFKVNQSLSPNNLSSKDINSNFGDTKNLQSQGGMNFANPFVSSQPKISPSDLAGLSPQDISSVLDNVQNIEILKQKKVTDVVDTLYKQKMMDYYDALIGEKTPSITVPGTDVKMTRSEYINWQKIKNKDERTAKMKNYEAYAEQEKTNNRPVKSMEIWDAGLSEEKRHYEESVASGMNRKENPFHIWLDRLNKSEDKIKTPSPVTWTTASNNVMSRFGKLDPTGKWAITDELQAMHRKAQKLLVEYKKEGIEPLEAVNKAETEARNWGRKMEEKYFQYLQSADSEDKIDKVKSLFYQKYGYLPNVRR